MGIHPRYHSNCDIRRPSSGSNKPFAFTQQSRKLLLATDFQRFNSEGMGL